MVHSGFVFQDNSRPFARIAKIYQVLSDYRASVMLQGIEERRMTLACASFPIRVHDIGTRGVLLPLPGSIPSWHLVALIDELQSCDTTIAFSTGLSSLRMHPDGRIALRGNMILAEAKTTLKLRGGAVEIN